MSNDFTLEFCEYFINVNHPAKYEITPEGLSRLWKAIGDACKRHNCRRVLSEAQTPPERRLGTTAAFLSAEDAITSVPGLIMACFFRGYKADDTTEFFKMVAHNRGARIEFFSNREEALEWLSQAQ
jgi:hypothetical protein